jgi:3-dehydroquinate synthase
LYLSLFCLKRNSLYTDEVSKQIRNSFELLEKISEKLTPRKTSHLIAIGGGVTLNVAGFWASLIARGIKLTFVPTTPIAVADVVIGAKHSLNIPNGKNYLGTYYDPDVIIFNQQSLESIPLKRFRLNNIESLKQFLYLDKFLFEKLINMVTSSSSIEYDRFFEQIIWPTITQKIELLNKDSRELQQALPLHAGHVFAHSFEAASDFKICHDDAVARGLLFELQKLNSLGLLGRKDFQNVNEILINLIGREPLSDLTFDRVMASMRNNKLIDEDGMWDAINLTQIGKIGNPMKIQADTTWFRELFL